MDFHLENANEINFDILSKKFRPTFPAYKKRVETQKRFGKDGEAVVGDEQVNGRTIDFRSEIVIAPVGSVAARDQVWADTLNDIAGFFLKENSPFFLIDDDLNTRTEIRLTDIENPAHAQGTEKRIHNIRLKFKMLDGHWEDEVETEQEEVMSSGSTVVVNNDSKIDTFPLIEIVPANTNSDLLVRNETTGDSFILGSNNFGPGTTFLVDSRNGTIILDDGVSQVESSISLADGSGFIKLAPGDNTIFYESVFGDSTLTFKFRRRFAF